MGEKTVVSSALNELITIVKHTLSLKANAADLARVATTGSYNDLSGKPTIPSVPQMATAADMSDWVSGKTVDAATLKTDFQAALMSLGDKANASSVYTKTEIDNKGYQTAAQVQTAIAGVRQLPTGGSVGDFLRKDSNGNAAWETVQTWQGGSY